MRWTTAAVVLGMLPVAAVTAWAQPSTNNFNVSGPADWNTAGNWIIPNFPTPLVPGDGFPDEVAGISNGGIAQLTSPAQFEVFGLVLGETHDPAIPNPTTEDGTLNISGTGELRLVDPGGTSNAALRIGAAGRGVLNFSGGTLSADTLSVGGDSTSTLNLSGASTLAVSGDASLERITRIEGPDVIFDVEGELIVRGTFVSVITGPMHSPVIAATGRARLGGTLQVEFNGHVPQFGDSWNLIDAGELAGEFAALDTSAAPALPDGLQYRVDYLPAAGDAILTVGNTLVLTINRANGLTTMSNVAGGPIDFDGYSILSDSGVLSGSWNSFADSGAAGPGWLTANPSDNNLSELNLTGSSLLPLGESLSIGNPYAVGTPPEDDDLVFQYTSGGAIIDGIVLYIDMPMLLGDTNGDGVVNIDDLNNVRNNFGAMGLGDTDGDGDVDIDDLNNVRNNFGAMAAAVPEPSSLGLLLCALTLVSVRLAGGLRPRR